MKNVARHRQWLRLPALLALALAASTSLSLHAQDLLDLTGTGEGGDEEALMTLPDDKETDYERLAVSHFSEVWRWPLVAPLRVRARQADVAYRWQAVAHPNYEDRPLASPASDQPIQSVVNVPAAGKYRVWLSYIATTKESRPVTLLLSGATAAERVFGKQPLPATTAEQIEEQHPLRFESDRDRVTAAFRPVMVWEYWDLALKAGPTTFTLAAKDKEAMVDTLFLTQSLAFVPSKSADADEGNLNRVYYRYRALGTPAQVKSVHFNSFARYNWVHYRKGSTKRIWYGNVGNITATTGGYQVPVGVWSDWADGTELVTNRGPYCTHFLGVTTTRLRGKPVTGTAEVQLAWFRDPAAVLRTIRRPIEKGRATHLLPVSRTGGYDCPVTAADDKTGVWGMRSAAYVAQLQTEAEALQKLYASIDPDDLKEGRMPWRIRIFSSCMTSPSAFEVAVPLLKKAGINWIPNLPFALKKKYGLHLEDGYAQQSGTLFMDSHCPLDPVYESELWRRLHSKERVAAGEKEDPQHRQRAHWLKMGDEIGVITGPDHINGLPDCRAAFHDYLRERAQEAGADASFFGAQRFDQLTYTPAAAETMRRPERRLFYHSKVFSWYLTARFYERHTRAAQAVYPNILTRCNYTPGGPMFAGDMGRSNWLALARYNASSAHSAEDWLSSGNKYTSHAGIQTESYYAAIVKCGARKYKQPLDFIMVGRSRSLDRKLPLLVANGIYQVRAYDWGPQYSRGAIDTWSHVLPIYGELNRAARILGPVEDMIIDGKPAPSRVALLYNRTHEIWHGGAYGYFSDRLYTYLALRQSHLPVDLVLEEDLTPELLAPYRALYLNGINLRRQCLAPLEAWVRNGGILVASAGAAMRDEYDDPMPEADALLGASQRLAGASKGRWMPFYIPTHKPIDRLTIKASALTPAIAVDVVGVKTVLTPTTGASIGTYADGSCGAVVRELGRGKVLLLGVMPGQIYSNNAPRDDDGRPTNYHADRRQLVALPATRSAGSLMATYTEPLVELYAYDHPDGIVVLATDFTYDPGKKGTLSVRTPRPIKSVSGVLGGPMAWRRDGDYIRIDCPVPAPSDAIVLR